MSDKALFSFKVSRFRIARLSNQSSVKIMVSLEHW